MKPTFDSIWQGIVHRPQIVLLGLLLITSFFFYQLATRGLPLDNSPNSLMVSQDQALSQYDEAIETFGDDRVMIVALLAFIVGTAATFVWWRSADQAG